MKPGEPITVWSHHETGPSEHFIELDYRLSVSWDVVPSVGGYVLEIPYYVVGDAVLRAGTVWPTRVSVGEPVTIACVRERAVTEHMELFLHEAGGELAAHTTYLMTDENRPVAVEWIAAVPAGEYTFRLQGTATGLCAAGRLEVMDSSEETVSAAHAASLADPNGFNVTLQAELDRSAAIGQWTWLSVRVANRGTSPVEGLRIVLSVPTGLVPLVDSDALAVPPLRPGEEWRRELAMEVTPAARAGYVEVRLSDGLEREVAVQRLPFVPEADSWLRPAARLRGPERRTELQQGWHVLWSDGSESYSAPRLVDVKGAAPLEIDDVVSGVGSPGPRTLRAGVGLIVDRDGLRPYLDSTFSFSLGELALAAQLRQDEADDMLTLWHIQASGPSLFEASETWSGYLKGNREALSGLHVTWHAQGGTAQGRYGYAREQGTWFAVRLWEESTSGGILVRHRLIAPSVLDLRLWRPTALGRFRLQADLAQDQPDKARLDIGYEAPLLGGQLAANVGRYLRAVKDDAVPFGLLWTGSRGDVSPLLGMRTEGQGISVQLGIATRNRSREDLLRIELGPGQASPEIDWRSRWGEPNAAGQFVLRLQPPSVESGLAFSLTDMSNWALEAETMVRSGGETDRVKAVATLLNEGMAFRWSGSLETSQRVHQADQRIDAHSTVQFGARSGRVGLFAGVRTVRGQIGTTDPQRTKTGFLGGWLEVEALPHIWAGVALAKWNREIETEYDVYLRYEVTPAFWLQVGVHQAPGPFTLFPDHGRGAYARLLWAMSIEG